MHKNGRTNVFQDLSRIFLENEIWVLLWNVVQNVKTRSHGLWHSTVPLKGSISYIWEWFTFTNFFFFLIERAGSRWGGERREGDRILSRLHTQGRVQHGAWSHDPAIVTWAEIKSRLLNRQSPPGALPLPILLVTISMHLSCFQMESNSWSATCCTIYWTVQRARKQREMLSEFLGLPAPESLTIPQCPSCIFLSFLWFSSLLPSPKLWFRYLLCQ